MKPELAYTNLTLPAINQIPYWEVEQVWDKAGPMLQKAIDTNDEWHLETVFKNLILPNSNMQLWMGNRFALVTQIQVFPTGVKKCLLFLCGGSDLEAIESAQAKVEEWARKFIGCQKLIIYGRRGWIKALGGFKERQAIMEKQL